MAESDVFLYTKRKEAYLSGQKVAVSTVILIIVTVAELFLSI